MFVERRESAAAPHVSDPALHLPIRGQSPGSRELLDLGHSAAPGMLCRKAAAELDQACSKPENSPSGTARENKNP